MEARYIIASILNKKPLPTPITDSLVTYAVKNKVLYPLGLPDPRIKKREEWQELAKRKEEKRKALATLAEIAEENHIDLRPLHGLKIRTCKTTQYSII